MVTVACASGKGGTGKTTVATNLATVLAREDEVQLLDCDVENPNSHLFLNLDRISREEVEVQNPEVDEDICSRCGDCVRACNFSAISLLAGHPMVFTELCHSCGVCSYLCPEGAISEVGRAVGFIRRGKAGSVSFAGGELNPGEAIAVPVIDAVKGEASKDLVMIDAPPGTSCPVIASVRGADLCLLVTEPTPFGLSDLKMAVGMCEKLRIPIRVVINQCDIGDDRVEQYCRLRDIPILAQLPWDRELASTYARGSLIAETSDQWSERFQDLGRALKVAVGRGDG